MFNRKRKRIEELEKELYEKERRIFLLENNLLQAKICLDEITALRSTIPDHCVSGGYCRACVHSRPYHVRSYCPDGGYQHDTYYACARGKTCSDFVQMGVTTE